ncbi:uncharacterized protein AB9X84_003914 [Acanthopagrus schlegelii]
MATADLLVELMFSWIEKRENCAKKLKKLADELETLRKKCNAAECYGSTVSVIGAASLIGAGVATFFTAGVAAPALAIVGGLYSGVGAAVSVTAKIIEHFSSSDTLKDAEKIEEENNEIAAKIQNLFEQLKVEVRRTFPSADPDQVDQHVMTSFMAAVARRSGLKLNFSFSRHESFDLTELGFRQNSNNTFTIAAGLTAVYSIFTVFSLKTAGRQSKLLIAEATKQLIKEMSAVGLKTAIKGGAMVVGGAVGMGFALPEAIDNWKDLIEKNHETEASRSLRDTADDILKMCRTLKDQFDNMRTALEEMDKRQREEEEMARRQREEEEMARRQREEQEMARRQREAKEMARRQREEQEMARRQREEEEMARRQREAKEMARRQREEQEMARRQREEQEMARRQREAKEMAARRQREEEEMARRQREAKEMARRQREEEEMARRQREAKEMVRRRREEEEMARRQREEEEMARRQREEEEMARRQREAKEMVRRRREEEEMARRQREEEEMARRQREAKEMARRQREEEEMARRQREAKEMARRQREEEEMARRRQEYEMLIRQQKPEEKLIGKKNNQQRQNPVQVKSVNLMTQTYQRHVTKQCDQSEQTGREQKKNSQQTESEQKKDSQQAEQTGGGKGDNERDGEDEERDQEEEEDDSEEETEEDESDSEEETEEEESDSEEEESEQTGRKKKKKHHRKNRTSNRQIQTVDQCEINPTPPGTIRFGLLNVRSMNQRTSRISELITRNNLNVFLTTETWLRDDTADRVLREASPEGFRFHYQVRTDGRRGGGVANQFSEELQGEQIHFDSLNITTFKFVVTELQHDDWNQPVVIINLYHPPGYNQQRFRTFLNEFQSLLDEVRETHSSIIVTGDFNIHVNEERRSYTDEFDFLLWINNFTQHLEEPTHEAGNTLDLVITSNVEISGLIVQDDGISDHYTVYFNAKPKDTTDKTEENENEGQKRFRKTEE